MPEVIFVSGIILLLAAAVLYVLIGESYRFKIKHYPIKLTVMIIITIVGLFMVFGSLYKMEKKIEYKQIQKAFERVRPQ